MHQAIMENGEFILAEDFARHDPGWVETNRVGLKCPECGQPAYFRQRAKDGKAPCFGSRNHLDGCAAHAEVAQDAGRPGDDVPAAANDGTEYELILTGPFAQEDAGRRVKVAPDADPRQAKAHRHVGEGNTRHVRQRQLRTFLRDLVSNPAYMQDRDRTICIPGRGDFRATDLIREFSHLTNEDLDRHMLVWGAVEIARWQSGQGISMIYVNAGKFGSNPFTIVIEGPAAEALQKSPSWITAADHARFNTAPVHAIASGRVKPGPGNCPYAITLTDLDSFAFVVDLTKTG